MMKKIKTLHTWFGKKKNEMETCKSAAVVLDTRYRFSFRGHTLMPPHPPLATATPSSPSGGFDWQHGTESCARFLAATPSPVTANEVSVFSGQELFGSHGSGRVRRSPSSRVPGRVTLSRPDPTRPDPRSWPNP